MFTGVIHHLGKITACEKQGDWRITVETMLPSSELTIGDSIACNGCCLTIIDIAGTKPSTLSFSLSAETLVRTTPRWEIGDILHLERAMKLGDTLDGHLVSGHVDGLAKIIAIQPSNDSYRMECEVPVGLALFIAPKGSVTLDGIALTINEVQANRFTVNIIPHTWKVTTFQSRSVGDALNLEIDMIARYIARRFEVLSGANG